MSPDGRRSQIQGLCDLVDIEALEVPQDENFAFSRVEAVQEGFDLTQEDASVRGLGSLAGVFGLDQHLDRYQAAALKPAMVVAGRVHGDLEEPAPEGPLGLKARKRAIGPQEGVLGHVVGIGGVPAEPPGQAKDVRLVAANQEREGIPPRNRRQPIPVEIAAGGHQTSQIRVRGLGLVGLPALRVLTTRSAIQDLRLPAHLTLTSPGGSAIGGPK